MRRKKVTFSEIVKKYNYPSDIKNEAVDFITTKQRNEPNIINKSHFKSDVITMFQEAMSRGILIVYGNLGRHPYLLEYYLDIYFIAQKVHIRSHWWNNIEIDLFYKDDQSSCDLLIILEPLLDETIYRPIYAKSLLVLTSFQQHCTPYYPVKSLYLGNILSIIKTLKQYTHIRQSDAYSFNPQIFFNNRVPFFSATHINIKIFPYQRKEEIILSILNMIDCISQLNIKSWSFEL